MQTKYVKLIKEFYETNEWYSQSLYNTVLSNVLSLNILINYEYRFISFSTIEIAKSTRREFCFKIYFENMIDGCDII